MIDPHYGTAPYIRGAYGIMFEGDDFNTSDGTPHWDKGNWLA